MHKPAQLGIMSIGPLSLPFPKPMPALDSLHTRLPLAARILLSMAFVVLATVLRFVLLPVDAGLVYLTFYWGVVVAFYLCGPGPGVLNVVLSGLAGVYFFSQPYSSFNIDLVI